MSTLAEIRSDFQTILNRDDCTAAQADTFLVHSMQRIQREVRIPSMERMIVYNADPDTAVLIDSVPVPDDLIQPIDLLFVNDGSVSGYAVGSLVPLDHVTYRQLQQIAANALPCAWSRFQASFFLRGNIPATSEFHLYYYGEFSTIADDTDENEIMASNPDLVVYGALAYAADLFDHPAGTAWEARYQQILGQVVQMAIDVEMSGAMSMAAAYSNNDGY